MFHGHRFWPGRSGGSQPGDVWQGSEILFRQENRLLEVTGARIGCLPRPWADPAPVLGWRVIFLSHRNYAMRQHLLVLSMLCAALPAAAETAVLHSGVGRECYLKVLLPASPDNNQRALSACDE